MSEEARERREVDCALLLREEETEQNADDEDLRKCFVRLVLGVDGVSEPDRFVPSRGVTRMT